MAKFVTIGERIHCISPVIRKAMAERDPEPVSYTHLDVYKRQASGHGSGCEAGSGRCQ